MNNIPSSTFVADLECNIAEDGFTPHEQTLRDVLIHARRACAPAEIVTTLADTNAPEFKRAKALLWITQDWSYYERRLYDLERESVPATIELLDAWREHDDLKKAGANPAELWGSRRHLDAVRDGVRALPCG